MGNTRGWTANPGVPLPPEQVRLHGEIRAVASLSNSEQARMLALMTAHYDNVQPEKFRADLDAKHSVVILTDTAGVVQGFTTFAVWQRDVHGSRVSILYSGDTIINQRYWGQLELFRVYGSLFAALIRQYPPPIYWLLLTKGLKTYGLLPLFFQCFYPNHATPTPAYEQAVLDRLATQQFNADYLQPQGIVRLTPQADRLKPALADGPERKQQKPHARFFLERNPGYAQGDELVCLAHIAPDNFTRLARRFVTSF